MRISDWSSDVCSSDLWVQQAIIDPEGDFVTLADHYGHIVVEAADYSEADVQRVAARVREHRASVVLNLEGLDVEAQMRSAAAFLGGLFDAHRDHWYPVLEIGRASCRERVCQYV